ncbi:MAG TPA: XdhC family protein [Verrucomicrobiae bacterium]|jgi:xanthine dehydrogenase accessory factor
MNDDLLRELLAAREQRVPCALVTVAATTGSVPRQAGAKMIVYEADKTSGTVGGGKFEALVIQESRAALRSKTPLLKTYPLREGEPESFGAICGGEVTVLIEPQAVSEAIFLVGAGHCARAIGKLATDCGWHVTVMDDRADLLADFPAQQKVGDRTPAAFIASRAWQRDEALVIVSRNFEVDREALHAALGQGGMGYLGMIGSHRKVHRVFDDLKARGVPAEKFAGVYAPLGLDVGADAPAEIATSVMAEVMRVLRGRPGGHLRDGLNQ